VEIFFHAAENLTGGEKFAKQICFRHGRIDTFYMVASGGYFVCDAIRYKLFLSNFGREPLKN